MRYRGREFGRGRGRRRRGRGRGRRRRRRRRREEEEEEEEENHGIFCQYVVEQNPVKTHENEQALCQSALANFENRKHFFTDVL
jgi:hypothetical protein